MSTKLVELVSALHDRCRKQGASYDMPQVAEGWADNLARLHSAYNAAYGSRQIVGRTPQLPNTLLGIVAAPVIAILQRLLSWYTPQIVHFNQAAVTTLNQICSLEERSFHAFLALSQRVDRLEAEMRCSRTSRAPQHLPAREGSAACSYPTSASTALDPGEFYLALQTRFRSSDPSGFTQLQTYLSTIANLAPPLPDGPWLDIGSGRGTWLRLAREAGHEATGVDSNVAVIERCTESGLHAVESDALRFLESAADKSFSVITAFHLLEHLPFEYCLNLTHQARRVLKPGGVLLVETPNPANILMATEQFWKDPTHRRPIPAPLMIFLFEYCGFAITRCFEINPRAESERLPLRELEPLARLDALLYGPQDYAILARCS